MASVINNGLMVFPWLMVALLLYASNECSRRGGSWLALQPRTACGDCIVRPINRPRLADGLWFAAQMLRWGQYGDRERAFAAARAAYAPTAHDAVFGTPEPAPSDEVRPFDGAIFSAAGYAQRAASFLHDLQPAEPEEPAPDTADRAAVPAGLRPA